ncbi:class I SAM-dependent methyltransferase [Streptomyces sp. NBC_01795]|uniref:class I SAM-dependent methyltransferase n=1 Tax=unclassified Streptomyces TaxID=2593676 RepID=UPI002DDA9104|nr:MULTISPECIES: class I SAM-dependent methyltransferase [unclassified Streptomyces]WSA93962.1 class I SAM-dependent methyltransferase [Streptomyces sp. NBC_01795]WSB78388.1 class I SAM-dependent methyltransferase [Streptomyces sp. NBC_01775]
MAETAQEDASEREFWDERYREREQIWSGEPNTQLVKEVADLATGTALDLGCGEGGDAIWLAGRGWQVKAVDISDVALTRAARHAADAGVRERIVWERHDLGASFPQGTYDLVSAQFLYSPGDMPRERILRDAAAAVAPGGVLLIVGHAGRPSWEEGADHPDVHFPTPEEVLAGLRLADGEWEVLRADEHERFQDDPDGRPMTRTDNAVLVRRSGAAAS